MITISVSAKARNARKPRYCRRNQGKCNDTGLLTAYKFTKIVVDTSKIWITHFKCVDHLHLVRSAMKSSKASKMLRRKYHQRFTCLTATPQVHIYILEPTPKGHVGEAGTMIGQRSMLSKVDCMKLNQKFGCFKEGDTWHNEKIRWAGWVGAKYPRKDLRPPCTTQTLHISLPFQGDMRRDGVLILNCMWNLMDLPHSGSGGGGEKLK